MTDYATTADGRYAAQRARGEAWTFDHAAERHLACRTCGRPITYMMVPDHAGYGYGHADDATPCNGYCAKDGDR